MNQKISLFVTYYAQLNDEIQDAIIEQVKGLAADPECRRCGLRLVSSSLPASNLDCNSGQRIHGDLALCP